METCSSTANSIENEGYIAIGILSIPAARNALTSGAEFLRPMNPLQGSVNKIFRLARYLGSRTYYVCRQLLGTPPQSNAETWFRLCRLAESTPRSTPGTFLFSFGALAYTDAQSLRSQFEEIFMQGGYDFQCRSDNPFIIDCGANVGLSVIRSRQMQPNARIIAFEADPAISTTLRSNLSRLGLSDIEVVNAAVWDGAGTIGFVADGADGGHVSAESGTCIVPSISLSDYITQTVDLLKLDIEGAEKRALLDLCATGKIRMVDRIICELHGSSRQDFGELLSTLKENGYRITFSHARSAPDMPGESQQTPFAAVPDGRYLLHLYAWRDSLVIPEEIDSFKPSTYFN
ncbi:MAG: methyltransferase FkbM family [Candidatus Angelobacter sp.]|nr:methyltransferase FkbM family [Candidatus Angelobacter sp.]